MDAVKFAERAARCADEQSMLRLPRVLRRTAPLAEIALADGDPAGAAEHAHGAVAAAAEVDAPIDEAHFAHAGRSRARRRRRAATTRPRSSRAAAALFERCGALPRRDAADRELGKLGRRVHRRTKRGKADGTGIELLTERELEVARLVVDRKTNAQIAAELFLSPKTVETHIRHLFQKLEVSSRVEVARVVERADREPSTRIRVRDQGLVPMFRGAIDGKLAGSNQPDPKGIPWQRVCIELVAGPSRTASKVLVGWLLVLVAVFASASRVQRQDQQRVLRARHGVAGRSGPARGEVP